MWMRMEEVSPPPFMAKTHAFKLQKLRPKRLEIETPQRNKASQAGGEPPQAGCGSTTGSP